MPRPEARASTAEFFDCHAADAVGGGLASAAGAGREDNDEDKKWIFLVTTSAANRRLSATAIVAHRAGTLDDDDDDDDARLVMTLSGTPLLRPPRCILLLILFWVLDQEQEMMNVGLSMWFSTCSHVETYQFYFLSFCPRIRYEPSSLSHRGGDLWLTGSQREERSKRKRTRQLLPKPPQQLGVLGW